MHMPFHHRKWLKWQLQVIKDVQPAYVVQVGDLKDIHFASKYAKTLNIMTPAQEIKDGRRYAEDFWSDVRALVPKARKIQLQGNHEDRINKRLFENAPYLEGLLDLEEHMRFEGVETVGNSSEELFLGNVVGQHGYMNFGAHARHNQMPTFCGHSHHGGVVYYQNRLGTYWELNVGFGGDRDSRVFGYRNRKALDGWTLGCGIVDELGPRFATYAK